MVQVQNLGFGGGVAYIYLYVHSPHQVTNWRSVARRVTGTRVVCPQIAVLGGDGACAFLHLDSRMQRGMQLRWWFGILFGAVWAALQGDGITADLLGGGFGGGGGG